MPFHFILTGQFPTDDGYEYAVFTTTGTIDLRPGATKTVVYEHLINQARENFHIPSHAKVNVLFFSLERDQLVQPMRAAS